MQDQTAGYIQAFCRDIQALDEHIRFVGIADYSGQILCSHYREGLVPLMDRKETDQYSLQTVFRSRTRGGFKPQLGEQLYTTTVYERLIRATATIISPEAEHHNLYLLLSFDVGTQYPTVFDDKVLPFIERSKPELFKRTLVYSEKYED